jgi:ribosome-associated translation inhibitor RaiA
MKIRIHWPGGAITAAMRVHVEKQVGLALGKFGDGVSTVTVRLSTTGRDNHCEIHVALRIREVSVEEVHVDPLRAVDFAAARLSDRVALALESARR